MKCDTCPNELGLFEAVMASRDGHRICMNCVQARAKAAHTKRCSCGRLRRPVPGPRGRTSCDRCLGAVPERLAGAGR